MINCGLSGFIRRQTAYQYLMNRFPCLAALFILILFSTCSKDDSPETPGITPEVEISSLTEGEVVGANLGVITLVYSVPVKISPNAAITVGSLKATATATNKSVAIKFGAMEYDKTYILTIPSGSVLNKNDNTSAGTYTLTFRTEKEVAANPEIPQTITWNIDVSPVNPNASVQTKNVYNYLRSSFGIKCLSGTMAEVNWNIDNAVWVHDQTGKWPAMTCFDLIHYTRKGTSFDTWVDYDAMVTNATNYWNNGGLVSIMWHWLDPSRATDQFYSDKTSFDISKISDVNSSQYKAMIKDIDSVAVFLKKLKNAGVPVIWRPLHEAEGSYRYGDWFWWGSKGAAACVQLWKTMYERLVNYHGLNNLIWVWTVNLDNYDYLWYADATSWYPGKDYVDIIGIDIYDDAVAHGPHVDFFKKTALIAGSRKIVALSECGHIPDPAQMQLNGDKWSYFMPWYGDYTRKASYNGEYWNYAFQNSFIITRDELPDFKN